MRQTPLQNPAASSEDSFIRTAGRQLLLYTLMAVVAIGGLMFLLDALAGLVGSESGNTAAVEVERNMITISLRDEPPQLDSGQRADQISGMVLGHIMEGLLIRDAESNLVGGVAQRWEVNERDATFWLRKNARWSDGEPVTAHDFVFAWRKAADPAQASEYAFVMYYLKNGEAVAAGELPLEALGVRAIDDHTLYVELERPTAFFDKLVAFQTYYPIREDFFHSTNGRYSAGAKELLYNGRFKLTNWVHGSSLLMEKNEHYWNKDDVKLDAIKVGYITRDGHSRFNFFKDNKIAYARLEAEQLYSAMENHFQIRRYQDGSLFFLEFNHREDRPTSSWHLRRAMQLVTDSGELVNKVTKLPGYLPGRSLFPVYLRGVNSTFREEFPAPEPELDPQQALLHIQQAKAELGVEEIPPLTLLIGDTPIAKSQAEYFQEVYQQKLGLDIKIDAQIFKQRLDKMGKADFDIVMAGWGPDYDDALTFGDLFASWNLNNHGRWAHEEYDAMVAIAQNSIVPEERMAAFARMQQLIYDEVVILPHYERGNSYVTHPQLKGMVRRAVGSDPDLRYAYIEAE